MAHFLCHLGCSHFGALLLDFYFTENITVLLVEENDIVFLCSIGYNNNSGLLQNEFEHI